jgi:predicted dehydrogenase
MGTEDGWSGKKKLLPEDENIDLKKYGYESLDELVHWRIHDRTGAGLMAELGSHQLDAASIFLGKIHPVAVEGVGVKSFFKDNREIEDHIFLAFEFPGEVVVTYSSISTNAFDDYGEQVMGTKGTMIVQAEQDAYLFREMSKTEGESKDTRITWAENRISRPTTEAGSSTQWVASVDVPDTLTSRGYREEQEHMAWIIRNGGTDCQQKPRCNGRVALVDAAIALTANLAMKHNQRIELEPEWFDPASDAAPEKDFPNA